MYYPGFFERKELDKAESTLRQLEKEKEQVNMDIEIAKNEVKKARRKLDLTMPKLNFDKKERVDDDYVILWSEKYYK